ARVQHMAEYDALTDLPNRVLVNDRLHQAIRQAELQHNQLAVLFVDLDHFKNINDTLGHCAGDELLKQVARRLAESVRGVDTVGRTGGDEFVLILPSINQPSEAALIAERILRTLQQPCRPARRQPARRAARRSARATSRRAASRPGPRRRRSPRPLPGCSGPAAARAARWRRGWRSLPAPPPAGTIPPRKTYASVAPETIRQKERLAA
ncbi:GGDEF domain-containing protein, partial (plasmid) [Chromobacterium amazonense]|uniref:diguanylate cyclase domain-containing protein n=1 Tax=Chromobacterium amazonense TaxID=1382803 RepID=UPI00237E8D79